MSLLDRLKQKNYRVFLLIRRALCSQGVHDYEASHMGEDNKSVHLECFYCQRGMRSWFIQR